MRKLLRTIRFDDSDVRLFDLAAGTGEWAVSGAFEFAVLPREEITGRTHRAFASGFLGLGSFGRSTFAAVREVSDRDIAQVERRLAEHLVARYCAPSLELAFEAAGREIALVLDLCREAPVEEIFTVRRTLDAASTIHEAFHRQRAPC